MRTSPNYYREKANEVTQEILGCVTMLEVAKHLRDMPLGVRCIRRSRELQDALLWVNAIHEALSGDARAVKFLLRNPPSGDPMRSLRGLIHEATRDAS